MPGQPTQKRILFSPVFADSSYHLRTSTTLAPAASLPLTGGVTTDDGNERTITDPNADAIRKFNQVQILKP